MRAVTYSRFGGPEVLEVSNLPVPEFGSRELRVQVVAAGLNPLDWKLLQGAMRLLRGRTRIRQIGCDFAGRVEAVGQAISEWKVGDAVFGSVSRPLSGRHGALAERLVVQPREIARKPDAISFAQAAALPIAGASALRCFELARLHVGAQVLVIGASGGVGSMCVRLGSHVGAHITGVCRAANERYVRELGAEHVIAYDREDVLASRGRFDAIIDTVGNLPVRRLRASLRPGGVMAVTMPRPSHILAQVRSRLLGGRQVRALFLRVTRAHLDELARRAAAGHLHDIALTRFPLDEVRSAFTHVGTGHTRGKLIVDVSPESGPR